MARVVLSWQPTNTNTPDTMLFRIIRIAPEHTLDAIWRQSCNEEIASTILKELVTETLYYKWSLTLHWKKRTLH